MPNWVHNYLTITKGDPKVIFAAIRGEDRLHDEEHDDRLFDFNRLIPQPENLYQGSLKLDDTDPQPNWYDWNNANWGTKWNACRVKFNDNPKRLDLHGKCLWFETAWAPPMPIMEKLFAMFPDHEFRYGASEPMNDWYFDTTVKNGVMAEPVWGSFQADEETMPLSEKELAALGVELVND